MKKNVIKTLITSFTLTIIDQMRLLIFGSGASLQVYHSFMSGQKPPGSMAPDNLYLSLIGMFKIFYSYFSFSFFSQRSRN